MNWWSCKIKFLIEPSSVVVWWIQEFAKELGHGPALDLRQIQLWVWGFRGKVPTISDLVHFERIHLERHESPNNFDAFQTKKYVFGAI